MAPSSHNAQQAGFVATWLAPTALSRDRVLERAGSVDRVTRVMGTLTVAFLAWCALERGLWALVPLVVLVAAIVIGPVAVRRGARPEYWDFASGLMIFTAMAVAAAMTGGPLSPIAYLLPVGLAVDAMRGVPRATWVGAGVTASVFLVACLLGSPSTVLGHPLATAALLVALVSVTMAATALAGAEIAYRSAAVLDPLTGLLNRKALEVRFEELRQQARLVGAPICLVLFDLDHFKSINDEHGHDVGDAILREVAYQVRKRLRVFELVYRMGGEEFLVVLPGISASQGAQTAEHLRETIDQARPDGDVRVTASFGVSWGAGEMIEFESLYRLADQALYAAKRDGRDRIRTSEPLALIGRAAEPALVGGN